MLDTGNIGAGSIDAADSMLLQKVDDAFELSVRTDDHRLPCRDGGCVLSLADAAAGKILYNMAVMDEVPQHPAAATFRSSSFRQVHGALDAITKTGAFGQDHLHSGFPPTSWPPRA